MATDISGLDMAEKGDSHGNLVEETPRKVVERDAQPAPRPLAQSQASVTQAQDEGLEQVNGPGGLARVKDYDRCFAFYPSFSVERSLALEFRAQSISRLSMEIHALRKELKPEDSREFSNMAPTDAARERLEELMTRLTESLAQYDAAWVHAKIVDSAEAPEESTLDQLRLWLNQRSKSQAQMYRTKKWHEFRMFAPPKGPIEKLVKAVMPLSRLGRIFLRPFRSHSVQFDNLHFLRYEDADLSWVVGVLLLLGICLFLVLLLAILSFFDTNRSVRMALVLVMCFLVSVFARVIEADEARQVVFVCVYSAVMSGFLSQMP